MVIIIAYGMLPDAEARTYAPHVVHVDAANRITSVGRDPGLAPEGLRTAAVAWASGR
jgi:aspartate 1-decarboxylase